MDDFYNTDIFEKYLPEVGVRRPEADNLIFETLRGHEERGYYKIEGNNIKLSERGIDECQRQIHLDWEDYC